MIRTLPFLALLPLAAPTLAATLTCAGTQPNWTATITNDAATFTLRDRSGDYSVKLTTPAKNDPDTIAYTLIGATDTAILIVQPQTCNTLDHSAHVLTQERTEAILLTGCCKVTDD